MPESTLIRLKRRASINFLSQSSNSKNDKRTTAAGVSFPPMYPPLSSGNHIALHQDFRNDFVVVDALQNLGKVNLNGGGHPFPEPLHYSEKSPSASKSSSPTITTPRSSASSSESVIKIRSKPRSLSVSVANKRDTTASKSPPSPQKSKDRPPFSMFIRSSPSILFPATPRRRRTSFRSAITRQLNRSTSSANDNHLHTSPHLQTAVPLPRPISLDPTPNPRLRDYSFSPPAQKKGALPPTSYPNSSSSSSSDPHQPSNSQQPLRFSTADRTILEELKRNIHARASQFIVKGTINSQPAMGFGPGGIMARGGGRHHAYPKCQVPYPRSYEREVVDLDIWETVFYEELCGSLTWNVFSTPPTKVLDLGCGPGTWILNCARVWKSCHFVGLDVVPLHPDLHQIGSSDLASRVTWVQANFLEGLPFPSEEFDFVHIKRIARGVPEDQWDTLLEEITRVMKPGAAFEMIEEDLFFPGVTTPLGDTELNADGGTEDPRLSGEAPTHLSWPGSQDSMLPPTPPRSASPDLLRPTVQSSAATILPYLHMEKSGSRRNPTRRYSLQAPRLAQRPVGSKLSTVNFHLPSRPSAQARLFSNLSSPPHPRKLSNDTKQKKRPSTADSIWSRTSYGSTLVSPVTDSGFGKGMFSKGTLRTMMKPPSNPRDHSLLERIYAEMHAARSINLAPLSLLPNLLSLHFKDVRTHPPIQFSFPPSTCKRPNSLAPSFSDFTDSSSSDSDEPRTSRRTTQKLQGRRVHRSNSDHQDNPRWLPMSGLIRGKSPFDSSDDARTSAYSSSTKTSLPITFHRDLPSPSLSTLTLCESPSAFQTDAPASISQRFEGAAAIKAQLPNDTLQLDLRSLNQHLALRTAEIIACAETMWEWVLEYQAAAEKESTTKGRSESVSPVERSSRQPRASVGLLLDDSTRSSILELSRQDFDSLLMKFDLDMRDQMALGSALEDRFGWSAINIPSSLERKTFDASCEKWEQWVKSQEEDRNLLQTHQAISVQSQPSSDSLTRSSVRSLPPGRRLSRIMRVFVTWKT